MLSCSRPYCIIPWSRSILLNLNKQDQSIVKIIIKEQSIPTHPNKNVNPGQPIYRAESKGFITIAALPLSYTKLFYAV
jgi:hypothetical protein